MKILPIGFTDYIDVINLLRKSHAESRYSGMEVSVDKAIEHLNQSIEEPEKYVSLKCVDGEDIVGVYMAYISTFNFLEIPFGFEWTFYVRPESRGTRAAAMLAQAVFDWMKGRNVNRFISVIHHADDNSKVYAFNEKMKMKEIGRIFERMM